MTVDIAIAVIEQGRNIDFVGPIVGYPTERNSYFFENKATRERRSYYNEESLIMYAEHILDNDNIREAYLLREDLFLTYRLNGEVLNSDSYLPAGSILVVKRSERWDALYNLNSLSNYVGTPTNHNFTKYRMIKIK